MTDPDAPHRPSFPPPVRRSVAIAMTLWLGIVIVWILLLGLEHENGCPPFDTADSSPFEGVQHWNWLPPGNECTYDIDNRLHVDRPSDARLGMIVLLICWPATTYLVALAARQG